MDLWYYTPTGIWYYLHIHGVLLRQSMKLSEAQLSQLLNYNTHVLSLDQLIEEDFSSEGGAQPRCSMEYGVMLKIWLSAAGGLQEAEKEGQTPAWSSLRCLRIRKEISGHPGSRTGTDHLRSL